jgi:hypothetical protein
VIAASEAVFFGAADFRPLFIQRHAGLVPAMTIILKAPRLTCFLAERL